jgi:beta-glucosidase/6-phospho-beta-glucosidase/beta-galactosidase
MHEEFFFDAVHHQNLAQGRVLTMLSAPGSSFIGVILGLAPARPASSKPRDAAAADLHDLVTHRAFLDPLLLGRSGTHLENEWRKLSNRVRLRAG